MKRKSRRKTFFFLFLSSVFILPFIRAAVSDEPRPMWNQEKAKEMVQHIIDTEKQGLVWDKVRWETDVRVATDRAAKENKPIFVYWYVKKGGPQKSPC